MSFLKDGKSARKKYRDKSGNLLVKNVCEDIIAVVVWMMEKLVDGGIALVCCARHLQLETRTNVLKRRPIVLGDEQSGAGVGPNFLKQILSFNREKRSHLFRIAALQNPSLIQICKLSEKRKI